MAEVFETCGFGGSANNRWRVVWVDGDGNAYYRDFPTRDEAADFARMSRRELCEYRASKAEVGD